MWLPPALFLLSLPGCFSLQGPESVSGSEEGSVTVQCHYDTGWETHRKWWCQGKIWNFCKILIQSRGSEQEVKKDRMSIRDNHRNRSFTVTMEKLSREDADTYWCGIEKKGSDLGVQVKVTVGPAKTVLTTPTNLSSKPLAMSSTFYVRVPVLPPLLMGWDFQGLQFGSLALQTSPQDNCSGHLLWPGLDYPITKVRMGPIAPSHQSAEHSFTCPSPQQRCGETHVKLLTID
ncbi:CMRF35-like molecule 7 isoform X2 [Elephas maximus indicus]|uniref:CMRF35-like molecule 7 isoform X2 n=1 Tax=Elephas maximus indicus TaxID=99487 RepID=UPI0021164B64|nr:CMRF35-like molecule 7 isoform X2 [Elephas maximus indicus]